MRQQVPHHLRHQQSLKVVALAQRHPEQQLFAGMPRLAALAALQHAVIEEDNVGS